jgi:Ubiquitin-conjugating enzyme
MPNMPLPSPFEVLGRIWWMLTIRLYQRTQGRLELMNDTRLDNDYRALRNIFAGEDRVDIRAVGTAPFRKYLVVYKLPSLRINSTGQPIRVEQTVVEITLPMGYPKIPPVAKTVAGDVVFHPNFSASKICLMDHWAPAVQLTDLIREIGSMLQWEKYNILSPLNAEAAEWSQKHAQELPLSNHSLGDSPIDISFK